VVIVFVAGQSGFSLRQGLHGGAVSARNHTAQCVTGADHPGTRLGLSASTTFSPSWAATKAPMPTGAMAGPPAAEEAKQLSSRLWGSGRRLEAERSPKPAEASQGAKQVGGRGRSS